ncbi:Predicted metal-binding protein related to the C-terminal domain of SecA [Cedecea davisae]|uniref:YecA family protein n=1 Tax=Cedecea davisae DSM 4568 TaxID=566551 RepID=S3ITP2_9ENTR|nr:YecA family protein [Cedecea davisae]EPF16355.1 yecA family protein [Cedecea davisae DSM 4568]SUX38867.1 Predicted metal-binding protein related to the C-terminal domain of SecA [Cedecea davisae]
MTQGPLNEDEIVWLDDVLMKYGTTHSVIDVAELDGLLTAILSGPKVTEPATVLRAVWGGDAEPEWENADELTRFNVLVFQHMNDIAERLAGYPEQFEPLFGTDEVDGREITIVEEWCYGYMRGVALEQWPALPAALQPALEAIALHGLEENLEKFDTLSPEAFWASIEAIKPAALELYGYWHSQRDGGALH